MIIIRPHIKILSGDYLCYSNLAHDRGIEPFCRLCQAAAPSDRCSDQGQQEQTPIEDIIHLLTQCRATKDTRDRYIPDLLNHVADYIPSNHILFNPTHAQLTQFILDCSSLNLSNDLRIPTDHPGFIHITKFCSRLIYAIHRDRTKQLKSLGYIAK